jgi:hypothetical protein
MPDDSDSDHPTSAARANAEKARDNSARNKRLITGAAIGIGSAALVAALLYANRSRKSDRS